MACLSDFLYPVNIKRVNNINYEDMENVNSYNVKLGLKCNLSKHITGAHKKFIGDDFEVIFIGDGYYKEYKINEGECVIRNINSGNIAKVSIGYNYEYDLITNKINNHGETSIKISNGDYKVSSAIRRGFNSISSRAGRIRCS